MSSAQEHGSPSWSTCVICFACCLYCVITLSHDIGVRHPRTHASLQCSVIYTGHEKNFKIMTWPCRASWTVTYFPPTRLAKSLVPSTLRTPTSREKGDDTRAIVWRESSFEDLFRMPTALPQARRIWTDTKGWRLKVSPSRWKPCRATISNSLWVAENNGLVTVQLLRTIRAARCFPKAKNYFVRLLPMNGECRSIATQRKDDVW